MMKFKLLLWFLFLLVLAVAVGGGLRSALGSETEVWLEDGRRFTRVELPFNAYLCEKVGEGKVRCIDMPLPPGSVLLIPIPEAAPVDSL